MENGIILITHLLHWDLKVSEFHHLGDCKKTRVQESSVAMAVHAVSHSKISIQSILYTVHGANEKVIQIISEGIQNAWLTSPASIGIRKEWLGWGALWPEKSSRWARENQFPYFLKLKQSPSNKVNTTFWCLALSLYCTLPNMNI